MCRNIQLRWLTILSIAIAASCSFALAFTSSSHASPSAQVSTSTHCGSFTSSNQLFNDQGQLVKGLFVYALVKKSKKSCNTARSVMKKYVNQGKITKGWKCQTASKYSDVNGQAYYVYGCYESRPNSTIYRAEGVGGSYVS